MNPCEVTMVCPKPRRPSLFRTTMTEPVRPLRWHMCHPLEPNESKAGLELLDIIFSKGGSSGCGGGGSGSSGGGAGGSGGGASEQTFTQAASSPPFFSGSPPSRVSNPLIQDARFGDNKVSPISPRSMIPNPAPAPVPSGGGTTSASSPRTGGCLRANFGDKPAVRVEGFDCLDRGNRRNCSIPTLA